ncbi:MAG: GUN4 domain-containing protein, partial [Rivularia sp. (in: cyanobacteria)]
CLVFEIPVPIQALEAVCNSISDYKKQLERAIELGLIEVSPEADESKRVYRVSRILPHIIPTIQLPEEPKVYNLYQRAHEILHQLWGNKENRSKEKWQEIFRLKFANKENPQRFRQGFYEMLAVQYNRGADEAFETELRKCRDDLVEDGLCKALENYLQQQQWKEADEETAWIFYQVMVTENYQDWHDLCKNFPCETLREIDRLWVLRSNNKFGISIQSKIFQESGDDWDNWDKFGDRIGWRVKGKWLSYDKIISTLITQADMTHGEAQPAEEAPHIGDSAFPVLIYTRLITSGGWFGLVFVKYLERRGVVSLLSRKDL